MSRKLVLVAASATGLGLVVVVGVPVVMMASLIGGMGGGPALASSRSRVSPCTLNPSATSVSDLDAEQISNARRIIAVGKSLHVPPRGWLIAIAAALQESGLRNLPYGDRDSLGLMQQRPSAGWGTPAQILNPTYAIRAFYGGPHSPTSDSGLLSVHGWQTMPLWQAAQSVQHSAFPFAYQQHEALAAQLVHRLAGDTPGCRTLTAGPWGLPVATSYTLTSGFGARISPTTGQPDFHTGEDFAVPIGTPARAVSRGVVVFTGWDGGYGNLIRIRHAHGVESWYGHLSAIKVHVGQHVRKGAVIGLTGSTGNSTGPHLHLEIRVNDQPTDPLPFLRSKGLHP